MYQYASIIGNSFFFVIWIFLFLKRKDLRKEMLLMSILVGFLGPFSEIWYMDYWRPEYTFSVLPAFEDYLFAFFIGGISAVIYGAFFGKKLVKSKGAPDWLIALLIIIVISTLIFLNNFLKINSIYASFISFLIVTAVIWWNRRDLIRNSILSGLFLAAISFIFYSVFLLFYPGVIEKWWLLNNISGVIILGMPIEEPIWFFFWGMMCGPLYEFWLGYRLRGENKN